MTKSDDCASHLHEFCNPCDCLCHKMCKCEITDKKEDESQREWLKRCMCMFHWSQTEYYEAKKKKEEQSE